MQARADSPPSDLQLYKRLLGYVTRYWHFFLFSFIGYALYSLGTVLLADLLQFLLDALNNSEQVATGIVSGLTYRFFGDEGLSGAELARIAVPMSIVLITILRALGYFAGSYFINYVSRNVIHRLRCELFNKLLDAPSVYLDSHSHGALISKITFNVEQVAGAATKALKTILRESLIVVGLLSYMLYVNWRLCLVFMMVAPFIAVVVRVVGKHFRRYSQRIQSSMGEVTQVANESLLGYREVRLFGAQEQQQQRFTKASNYNRVQSLKLAFAEALSTPVIQLLLAVALGVLVWLALSPAILSGFSAGSLVAFLTAASQLGKPIRQLSAVQSVIQRGLAAAQDIFAQLDQHSEPDDGGTVSVKVQGDIVVDTVSFSYPGATEVALDAISASFKAGETVALVGRSGSGKSTLVRLLTRFYKPAAGQIFLDAVPIEDYQLANFRQQVSVVSQDVPLFRDTIFNNIAFGALSQRSREQVLKAATLAHASEFIDRFPAGYETLLGDGGEGLSGGQKQRIAIARAILKDAPLLILDEATSALDYESEYHIQQALQSVTAERTTIVIAHRLSTVERADRILVLDRGRIVASGTHTQLLQEDGLYARLYHQEFAD